MMSKTTSTLLALSMLVAGYLAAVCSTPPNPSAPKETRHKTDRIGFLTGSVATIIRRLAVTVITYHILLTLVPSYAPERIHQICPQPQNPNQDLFSWSTTSTTALATVFLGAYIRLSAYGGLGRNFTFTLAAPDRLITTGVYGYMQHPSYTGQMLLTIGCAMLFLRWDGVPACWVSGERLETVRGLGVVVGTGVIGFAGLMLGARVVDEEGMLKEKFGQEWVTWHRRTSRFVPGLF